MDSISKQEIVDILWAKVKSLREATKVLEDVIADLKHTPSKEENKDGK